MIMKHFSLKLVSVIYVYQMRAANSKALFAIKNSYLYYCLNEVKCFGCINENFIIIQTLVFICIPRKKGVTILRPLTVYSYVTILVNHQKWGIVVVSFKPRLFSSFRSRGEQVYNAMLRRNFSIWPMYYHSFNQL